MKYLKIHPLEMEFRFALFGIAFFLTSAIFAQSWPCSDGYGEVELYRVTARSGLILRDAPNRLASKRAIIPFHKVIGRCRTIYEQMDTIDGKVDNWHEVSFQNMIGYVFGGFLEPVENSPIQMVIPNAGTMSIWDFLDFDSSYTWYALLRTDNTTYGDYSRIGMHKYGLKKVVLKNQPEVGNEIVFHSQPINLEEVPVAVFTGIPTTGEPFFGRWMEDKPLLPGETIHYQMFQEARRKWVNYTLYVEGQVIPGDNNEPLQAIAGVRDYAIWLQSADLDANRNILPGSIRKQCLFKGNIGMSKYEPYPQVYMIHFLGDLDGDQQLDLIIGSSSHGFNYQLYLSSEAGPGFLLKIVAEFTDFGC